MKTAPELSPNRADVTLRDDGVLAVELVGIISESIILGLLNDLETHIKKLRSAGRPVYILMGVNGVTGHSSLARSAGKQAARLDFDRGASYGGNAVQGLVMQYLQRSISKTKTRYFRRQSDALRWLRTGREARVGGEAVHTAVLLALPVILLCLVAGSTIIGWQASRAKLTSESAGMFHQQIDVLNGDLQRRMQVYRRTLYGFRGLFAASESVERDEYRSYFEALKLSEDYPGFSAISFVRQVSASQKAAYVARIRRDTSLNPKGYPNFTITPALNKPEYSVIEYVEPNGETNASFGIDLSTSPVRQAAFLKSRDSGEAVGTETVSLVGSSSGQGFLLTLPIYKPRTTVTTVEQRRAELLGYINAVFNYQLLFNDVVAKNLDSQFGVQVSDAKGNAVYSHGSGLATGRQTVVRTLDVGGQTFKMVFNAPPHYGISATSAQQPATILVGGFATVILLAVVMWQMLRSRRHAIELADNMTEDLEHERNVAIETQQQLVVAETALKREKASVEQQVVDRTAQLAEAQGRLLAAIRGLPFGFAVIDTTDQAALANHAFLHLVHQRVTNETAATQTILKRLAKDFDADIDLLALIHEAQSTGRPITRHISHGERFYRCYFHPIVAGGENGQAGRAAGAVVIIEDTTEQKVLERSRDEFFSIASHELRTPLTAIMGNTDMMLDFYGKHLAKIPELHEMVNDTHDASNRLITIVNDFLDMSSLEQGHTKFDLKPVDLRPLAEQVIRDFETTAKAQGLKLVLKAPAGPVMAMADAGKTHQILVNLMSNALAFTTKGSVTVTLKPGDKAVQVLVTDTGKGIPEEFRHLLFRKFQQASSDILTRESTRSTGLGLYISQLIARGMNSRLYLADSTVDRGSTFVIELKPLM